MADTQNGGVLDSTDFATGMYFIRGVMNQPGYIIRPVEARSFFVLLLALPIRFNVIIRSQVFRKPGGISLELRVTSILYEKRMQKLKVPSYVRKRRLESYINA